MPDEVWNAPINITKEQWISLLKDKETITEKDLRLLKAMYGCDGCKATAPKLAQLLDVCLFPSPFRGLILLSPLACFLPLVY